MQPDSIAYFASFSGLFIVIGKNILPLRIGKPRDLSALRATQPLAVRGRRAWQCENRLGIAKPSRMRVLFAAVSLLID